MSDTKKNKELISGTIIYALGNFGTKFINFLIVPLYTYFITTEMMGEYDILLTTVSLLTPLITLQIGDAAYRWLIGKGTIDSIYLSYKVLFVDVLITSISCLIIYAFTHYEFMGYFCIMLLGSSIMQTVQKMLRGFKNQKLFALSGVVHTFFLVGLNVLELVVLKRGLEGLLFSTAVSYFITIIFIFAFEKRVRCFRISGFSITDAEKEMLRYAIPLIPNQLNWWIMNSSDRYIIKLFLSNSANGIYAVSYKFPTAMQSIFVLFTNSFQDISVGDDSDSGEYYTQVFRKFSKIVFTTVMLAIPLSRLYVKLTMSSEYHEAANYIAFLYVGSAFQAFASYYGAGYLKIKDTKGTSITSILGAIANILINLVLINVFGLYAAAISTAVAFFIMWILRVIQVGNKMGIKIKYGEFMFYAALTIIFSVISNNMNNIEDSITLLAALVIFGIANKEFILLFIGKIKKIIIH